MINSPAPTTVGDKVAKGSVSNTQSTSQPPPVYIAGGDKGESRQVIQLVIDGKPIAVANVRALNSGYASNDFHTGNIPTQAQA